MEFVLSYVREFVFDPDALEDGEHFFYNYDAKEIPFYENQEGYRRDLELVERNCKMKPHIESPESFSEPTTPVTIHDTFASRPENEPVDVSSSGSLAKPPVSKCFAPKIRRIDLNCEN